MKTSTAKRDATPVIFRKFPNTGEVIALFPTLAATAGNPWPCLSYMKVGQHGVADPHLVRDTDPATDGEAATLKAELEAIGYCLEPVKRFTRRHFIARKLELGIDVPRPGLTLSLQPFVENAQPRKHHEREPRKR